MKTIFPSAVIEQSSECYQSKISVRSKFIYLSSIAFLFIALLSLPFMYIDLSVQARGTFQSSLERNEVFIPVSGRVNNIGYKENDKVQKGDVIAEIETEQLNLELQGYSQRIELLNNWLIDLKSLNRADLTKTQPSSFKSDIYAASYYEFFSAYENLKASFDKTSRDFERNKMLYDAKVISFTEFDESKLKYEQALSNLELHIKK